MKKKGSNIKKEISRYLKVKFSIRILRVFNQLLLEWTKERGYQSVLFLFFFPTGTWVLNLTEVKSRCNTERVT